jgi:hypothetical protein
MSMTSVLIALLSFSSSCLAFFLSRLLYLIRSAAKLNVSDFYCCRFEFVTEDSQSSVLTSCPDFDLKRDFRCFSLSSDRFLYCTSPSSYLSSCYLKNSSLGTIITRSSWNTSPLLSMSPPFTSLSKYFSRSIA